MNIVIAVYLNRTHTSMTEFPLNKMVITLTSYDNRDEIQRIGNVVAWTHLEGIDPIKCMRQEDKKIWRSQSVNRKMEKGNYGDKWETFNRKYSHAEEEWYG